MTSTIDGLRQPSSLWLNPLKSYAAILADLEAAFEREPVWRVKGLPLRIYASREPQFARAVYTHPTIGITKYPELVPRVVDAFLKTGSLIRPTGEPWRKQRDLSQPSFGSQHLDTMLSVVAPIVHKYIARWRQVPKHSSFDIYPDLKRLTVELNLAMLFGLEVDEDRLSQVTDATFFIDLEFDSMVPLFIPTPNNLKFKRAVGVMHAVLTEALVAKAPNQLVGHLMAHAATHDEALGEAMALFFGGSVFCPLLGFALAMVGARPECERELHLEARGAMGPEVARERIGRELIGQLKRSSAIVKETIRLFPGSWTEPRFASSELEILRYRIEKNSLLMPIVYLTHRHPTHWSAPKVFDPQRFLSGEAPDKFVYAPFGIGKRACVAAGLNGFVVPLVLSLMSRALRFRFVSRFEGDPIVEFGIGLRPKDAITLQFTEGFSTSP